MHLENLDLNLLVAIDALLRRRSVTEAAQELHVTQSALSSALKRARLHFEDELLYYDGQSMVPTAFGRELEQRIPDMVTQLRALSRMRSGSDLSALHRHFTIIASDYVAAVYISTLSRRLAKIAPNITLSVAPYTYDSIAQFRRGALDFLIGPDFALEPGDKATPLFEDRFKCVIWIDNPILEDGLTEDSFFASPLVVTNFFLDNGKSLFERWLTSQDRPVKVAASLPSFVLLPQYVAGTMNVATIHERLVAQFATRPDLVVLDPPIPVPQLQEFLVLSNKHRYDKEAQLLADLMLEVSTAL